MRRAEAERRLRRWRAGHERRDQLVGAAWEAGVSKNRISVLTGLARTTVERILNRLTAPDEEQL
jgi:hypothetical protein